MTRARVRLNSDEWSPEAQRTSHEVLVTFDPVTRPPDDDMAGGMRSMEGNEAGSLRSLDPGSLGGVDPALLRSLVPQTRAKAYVDHEGDEASSTDSDHEDYEENVDQRQPIARPKQASTFREPSSPKQRNVSEEWVPAALQHANAASASSVLQRGSTAPASSQQPTNKPTAQLQPLNLKPGAAPKSSVAVKIAVVALFGCENGAPPTKVILVRRPARGGNKGSLGFPQLQGSWSGNDFEVRNHMRVAEPCGCPLALQLWQYGCLADLT